MWLGFVASLKLLVLLPVAWLWLSGRRRAALIGAGVFAGCLTFGALTMGLPAHLVWLQRLFSTPAEAAPMGASLYQTAARITSAFGWPGAGIAWAVTAGPIVALSMGRLRILSDASFAALVAAAILVSPKGWVLAGVWLVGPAVALWLVDRRAERRWSVGAGLLMLVPPMAWSNPTTVVTLGSAYPVALVAVWWLAIRDSSRPRS